MGDTVDTVRSWRLVSSFLLKGNPLLFDLISLDSIRRVAKGVESVFPVAKEEKDATLFLHHWILALDLVLFFSRPSD